MPRDDDPGPPAANGLPKPAATRSAGTRASNQQPRSKPGRALKIYRVPVPSSKVESTAKCGNSIFAPGNHGGQQPGLLKNSFAVDANGSRRSARRIPARRKRPRSPATMGRREAVMGSPTGTAGPSKTEPAPDVARSIDAVPPPPPCQQWRDRPDGGLLRPIRFRRCWADN